MTPPSRVRVVVIMDTDCIEQVISDTPGVEVTFLNRDTEDRRAFLAHDGQMYDAIQHQAECDLEKTMQFCNDPELTKFLKMEAPGPEDKTHTDRAVAAVTAHLELV